METKSEGIVEPAKITHYAQVFLNEDDEIPAEEFDSKDRNTVLHWVDNQKVELGDDIVFKFWKGTITEVNEEGQTARQVKDVEYRRKVVDTYWGYNYRRNPLGY